MGGVVGGIVLIWRGGATPVNPPHHSDTGFYCLPCKNESRGGFTHGAFSPVRVVGSDRVRGPLTRRQHVGSMLSSGSPCGNQGRTPRDGKENVIDCYGSYQVDTRNDI